MTAAGTAEHAAAVLHDDRTRAVQAFHVAAAVFLAAGDRPMAERLERLSRDIGHHDNTDEALAGLMQAFAPTEEPTQ